MPRIPNIRLSPRQRQVAQSTALAVLVAGVATAAIEVSRWHPRASRAHASAASSLGSASADAARASFANDQRLVPVAPENDPPRTIPPGDDSALAAKSATAPSSASPPKFKSASELFAEANQARVRGDAQAAIATSQLLEATFPNSSEGITTHLSLGVLYLQQGQPELALQELKIYRHIGASELMAEALWNEEQALQRLGRTSDERAALEELLQNYPRSAYAAAAEQRLAALNN